MKKVYDQILKIVENNKDLQIFENADLKSRAANHIFATELREKYGIKLDSNSTVNNTSYVRLNEFMGIYKFGANSGREIAWSEDGSQPGNEYLLELSFPTGAYIFGQDYPKDLFSEMFDEFKSFKPKHSDMVNSCLYFSMSKAGKISQEFDKILGKYRVKYREGANARKISELQKEIEKLSNRS